MSDGGFCHYCQRSPCRCPDGNNLVGARIRLESQRATEDAKIAMFDEMRSALNILLKAADASSCCGSVCNMARHTLAKASKIAEGK